MKLKYIPTPIFTLINSKFSEVNDAFTALTGYGREELVGEDFRKIGAAEFYDLIKNNADADSRPVAAEVKIIRKDGKECWIHLTIYGMKVDAAKHTWGFAYDISQYKTVIDKLKILEAQYEDILDSMDEEVSREDPSGRILYVNNAFCRYYGKSKEEVIGTIGTDLVLPEDRWKYNLIKELTPDDPFYKFDCRVWNAEGKICWVQCTVRAFFNQSGQFVEYQEVGRDVTEIKNKQESIALIKEQLESDVAEKTSELTETNKQLRMLSSYLNNILQNISEGVAVIDENGNCETVNWRLEKTWGNLLPELMDYFKKMVADHPKSALHRMIHKKEAFSDQEIFTGGKDGNIHCMISGTPLPDADDGMRKGVVIIRDMAEVHQLVNRISGFRAEFTFHDIITKSPLMLDVINYAKSIADNNMNVMIEGESGTGKELFAQSIHNASKRRKEPFIAVNCGAFPNELVGSELFGYAEGSFTGAVKGGKPGKFELASGGTIFLDEIGDMPLPQQATLLRVLQEKKITRIGGSKEIPIDVRVICATNKDLYKEMEKGNFRQDLYYRLNVICLKIPALRDRPEDIPLLTEYFADEKQMNQGSKVRFRESILKELETYTWPGNVRELQNLVMRSIYSSQNQNTEGSPGKKRENENVVENMPAISELHVENTAVDSLEVLDLSKIRKETMDSLEKQEKQYIENLINLFDNNLSMVARKMKISRNTLYRKLDKYELKKSN